MARSAGEPNSRLLSSVRLTRHSFARRLCLFGQMYNVMDALHGSRAVTFDFCNNLRSFVFTVIVNIGLLRSVCLYLNK